MCPDMWPKPSSTRNVGRRFAFGSLIRIESMARSRMTSWRRFAVSGSAQTASPAKGRRHSRRRHIGLRCSERAAAGQVRIRAELSLAEELGVEVHVSSVTLTETLRGHRRDARMYSVLSGTSQEVVTPQIGRSAGELLGRANRDNTVDAIVAATAEKLGTRVRLLTGDPDDLGALTADMGNVTVVAI